MDRGDGVRDCDEHNRPVPLAAAVCFVSDEMGSLANRFMTMKRHILGLVAAAVIVAQSLAANGPPPAPLLFVKVIGPAGMKVQFHPGSKLAQTLNAPAVVGIRPGYAYRLELSGMAQYPGLKLYPILEVRGALHLPLDKTMRHPIPIVIQEDEIRRIVERSALVTRVHFLEDPALAPPIQTKADEPLVTDITPDYDPIDEAKAKGRLMIVMRVGEREPTVEELAPMAIPNTILFPGAGRLQAPPVGPPIPWAYWPVYDPAVGNRIPTEECLPDGGDVGPRVGIGPDGKVGGFNPSDTVIEYTTDLGRRKVAVSNRVHLCVPRFGVARQIYVPFDILSSKTTHIARGSKSGDEARNRVALTRADNVTTLAGIAGRKQPSQMQNKVALSGYESAKSAQVSFSISGTKHMTSGKELDEVTAYPFNEPISLFKWFDPKDAQIGDVVTIYLRYHNHTKHPVEKLVVSDNLTPRLEYVPGSARSDREASITIQPNEAGSVIMRFEIAGKLLPNQSGVVAFQVRVR